MLRSGGARRNEQDRMWIDAAGRDGHEAFQLISRSLHDLRDLVAAA
ncbi:phospholipase D/transphosphatidylase [Ralstonia solanacearum]|nr:phospholipase D/transphosphatidylase [Ralstonia solanacearum]NKA10710.1 phospholipase D/transphosphatidylase [Ralstonia solanacearum]NKA80113.1 phospholipase D/transphosphatidylase [Ralstonia solanacearum]NKG01288.1 phospholipase D/transphosphatidylase [Ralstonia solanacearum]NKG06492.1 phospholipase D/transphosphatidylase [Ralstonia solanacearum]